MVSTHIHCTTCDVVTPYSQSSNAIISNIYAGRVRIESTPDPGSDGFYEEDTQITMTCNVENVGAGQQVNINWFISDVFTSSDRELRYSSCCISRRFMQGVKVYTLIDIIALVNQQRTHNAILSREKHYKLLWIKYAWERCCC